MIEVKERFKKAWDSLVTNFRQVLTMTESNRRLIAGVVALLIKKGVITAAEVKAIESEVAGVVKPKRRRKRKKRVKND